MTYSQFSIETPGGRVGTRPYKADCVICQLSPVTANSQFSLLNSQFNCGDYSSARRVTVTSSGLFSIRSGKDELPSPRETHMTVFPRRYIPAV